jgi:hypothetical protein
MRKLSIANNDLFSQAQPTIAEQDAVPLAIVLDFIDTFAEFRVKAIKQFGVDLTPSETELLRQIAMI